MTLSKKEAVQRLADEISAYRGRWHRRQEPRLGPVRVMGVIEGYVVARFTGGAPFLEHVNNWHAGYQPIVGEHRR